MIAVWLPSAAALGDFQVDTLSVFVPTVAPGDTVDIEIVLANGVACAGLSFDLAIPEEAGSILSVGLGHRVNEGRLYHRWDTGSMRVVILDPEGRLDILPAVGPVAHRPRRGARAS